MTKKIVSQNISNILNKKEKEEVIKQQIALLKAQEERIYPDIVRIKDKGY